MARCRHCRTDRLVIDAIVTDVGIAPAAAASVRSAPERSFFRGANRSEAPAVPSLQALARRGALPLNGYSYPATFWHTVPMARQTVTCVLAGIALLGTVVFGQSSTPAKAAAEKAWSVPRTPDGHPDLQGVWANNGMTPLERPKQFGLRATMTDAELADLKRRATTLIDGGDAFFADELINAAIDGKTKFSSTDTQVGNYDQTWLSDRVWDNRTSLIVDPPDGRIPAPAAGAAERARAQAVTQQGRGPADKASDLSLGTRCISYGTPNIRAGYQSYFDITQGPGVVALRSEMIHDARIFSTDKTTHVSPVLRQYHGDSRARWDGDTLVVETTNYVANATRVGATDKLHTIEKFRRVAEDTLEYYVTFDDPTVWSRPWTMMIPLKMTGERMFEYACHEGNYGLEAILRGAREQEKQSTR